MEKFVSFVPRVRYIEIFFLKGKKNLVRYRREFVISGVRYMEGFYEGFLRGKRGGTEFGS